MDIYVKNLQGQEAKLESKQSNPTVAHAPDLSAEGDAQ
jgi:hypothetical protein